ncbi:hypothetical protein GBAR_LOCUS4592, partial [Geodia barretti]
ALCFLQPSLRFLSTQVSRWNSQSSQVAKLHKTTTYCMGSLHSFFTAPTLLILIPVHTKDHYRHTDTN